VEIGFEYICEMNDAKIFRKRKIKDKDEKRKVKFKTFH